MLSVKQGGIKYHFLRFWYDSTSDWTRASRAISEHFNHYTNFYTEYFFELYFSSQMNIKHEKQKCFLNNQIYMNI